MININETTGVYLVESAVLETLLAVVILINMAAMTNKVYRFFNGCICFIDDELQHIPSYVKLIARYSISFPLNHKEANIRSMLESRYCYERSMQN